jgi:hypothetical protein
MLPALVTHTSLSVYRHKKNVRGNTSPCPIQKPVQTFEALDVHASQQVPWFKNFKLACHWDNHSSGLQALGGRGQETSLYRTHDPICSETCRYPRGSAVKFPVGAVAYIGFRVIGPW